MIQAAEDCPDTVAMKEVQPPLTPEEESALRRIREGRQATGITIGVLMGVAIGAFFENVATGIVVGLSLGLPWAPRSETGSDSVVMHSTAPARQRFERR